MEVRFMKSCTKCGKVVADSATICPKCGCFAFHTDTGTTDGSFAELLNMILARNPKLFFILITLLGIGVTVLAVWYFGILH